MFDTTVAVLLLLYLFFLLVVNIPPNKCIERDLFLRVVENLRHRLLVDVRRIEGQFGETWGEEGDEGDEVVVLGYHWYVWIEE